MGQGVTWTAPQPIPGSPERRIEREGGGSVLKTAKGLYLAFAKREGGYAPLLGAYGSADEARASVEDACKR